MKSVDPGILSRSVCFTFQPNDFQRAHLKYMTWCGHYYCTARYYMERDSYPYILLLFVRTGEMDVRYEGRHHLLQRGDVLLIDCVHPHYYGARDGLEFLYMHFDGNNSHALTNYLIAQNGSPVFRLPQNAAIGEMLLDSVAFYEKGQVSSMLQEAYRIDKLLHRLSSITDAEIREFSPVEQAINFMQAHTGEDISLAQLAETANLSTWHFAHLFKRQTGYAPLEYVLKLRMEKAMLLLVHSQKSITEIAYEVGYGSPPAFINIFTRKFGIPPRAWRMLELGKRDKM